MRLAANECSVAPAVSTSTSTMMLGKIAFWGVPAPEGADQSYLQQ
jgi:hypothetical protein